LSLTTQLPRKRDVREVGDGDEQDEPRRGEQREEERARLLLQLETERRERDVELSRRRIIRWILGVQSRGNGCELSARLLDRRAWREKRKLLQHAAVSIVHDAV